MKQNFRPSIFHIFPAIILILFCATPCVVQHLSAGKGLEGAAQYGEMFGAANALFSGLALIFIIHTLLQQRQELEDTKKRSATEVELAAKSARLSVLPNLIDAEIEHLATHHSDELLGITIQTVDVRSLDPKLEEWKTRLASLRSHGNTVEAGHYNCFVRNIEALIRYKKDLTTLYDEIVEIEKAKL